MNVIWKECELVMLSTKDKTKIYLHESLGLNYFLHGIDKINHQVAAQHLHTTSNDVINDGDVIIEQTGLGYMEPTIATKENMAVKEHIRRCRKVIASTDRLLGRKKNYRISKKGETLHQDTRGTYEWISSIGKIPKSFIKEYCKLGGVDKVLVEYIKESLQYCNSSSKELTLKVDKDNTINIKPLVPKLFTIKEVKSIIRKHSDFISDTIDYDGISSATTAIGIPEWDDTKFIKDNII